MDGCKNVLLFGSPRIDQKGISLILRHLYERKLRFALACRSTSFIRSCRYDLIPIHYFPRYIPNLSYRYHYHCLVGEAMIVDL